MPSIIINEIRPVKAELGELARRKFSAHVASTLELPVTCRNATEAGSNVVEYTIQNVSDKAQAFVLYRGVKGEAPPYYFGNAFYAAYYGGINGKQIANYYDSIEVIAPNPANESAPYSLGMLSTGTKEYLTCFVFMVPPNSGAIKLLEGGISDCSLLIDVHAYIVMLVEVAKLRQFFSQAAIQQYVTQTGYTVMAPKQDPYVVMSVSLEALEQNIPSNEIFQKQYALKAV
ncbi:MAG: hypothetical protein PXY39_03700 [archaeon]|nr:hypothetical protein [archaeon]